MHVTWEIEVDTETPREAAEKALAIMRRPDSTATVFDVTDQTGETHHVDLMEDEPDE